MLWYTRESSVAVYVGNLPLIWPLLRDWFPSLRRFTPGNKSSEREKRSGYGGNSHTAGSRTKTIAGRHANGSFGGRRISEDGMGGKHGVTTTICGQGGSLDELSSISLEEGDDVEMGNVMRKDDSEERLRDEGWDSEVPMGGIHKSTTVHVSEEHVADPGFEVPAPVAPMVKRWPSARARDVDLDGVGSEPKEFKRDFEKAVRR